MSQIFPKWANRAPILLLTLLASIVILTIFIFWFWFSPWHLEVGYQPIQPIPFSHKIHAGKLRMNCLYCHSGAEKGPVAGVPSTQTCLNCHMYHKTGDLKKEEIANIGISPKEFNRNKFWTDFIMNHFLNKKPINWIRVHKVPDYAYFDHSAHVSSGIGCISCHGRVDKMDTIRLEKPLSMSWCLDCHRNPKPFLRPLDKVTDMKWVGDEKWKSIAEIKSKKMRPPVESCSGCHR